MEFNEEKRFSSLYICEQINKFREIEGNRSKLLHRHLLQKIESEFEQEINETKIRPVTYKDKKGENRKMYKLTYEQSLQLLMSESKNVRRGVVNVLKAQQEKINSLQQLPDFNNPAVAARAWADQFEARQLAEKENKKLKPKADFFDTVTKSPTTIDMSEAAKVLNLGIGRNQLFELLRDKGVFRHNNQPYQAYVDRGYFKIIETTYNVGDKTCIGLKTVVYQRGLAFIKKLYDKRLDRSI